MEGRPPAAADSIAASPTPTLEPPAGLDLSIPRRPDPLFQFELVGDPRAQGSKTRMPNGVWIEADEHELRPWRAAIAERARAEMRRLGILRLGYVILGLEFGFPRPQDHFKVIRGEVSAELKDWAARLTYARGGRDVDKMTRAVCDALQDAGLYGNDRRVVDFWVGPRRVYADHRYLRLAVWDAEQAEQTAPGARTSPKGTDGGLGLALEA